MHRNSVLSLLVLHHHVNSHCFGSSLKAHLCQSWSRKSFFLSRNLILLINKRSDKHPHPHEWMEKFLRRRLLKEMRSREPSIIVRKHKIETIIIKGVKAFHQRLSCRSLCFVLYFSFLEAKFCCVKLLAWQLNKQSNQFSVGRRCKRCSPKTPAHDGRTKKSDKRRRRTILIFLLRAFNEERNVLLRTNMLAPLVCERFLFAFSHLPSQQWGL